MTKNSLKLNNNLEIISAIFIIIFVSGFILTNFLAGFILPVYILAMGVSFVIALLFPRAGLFASIFLIIIFERFFTLSTIFIGRGEYKLYPIDIIFLAILISVLIQFIFRKIKSIKLGKSEYFLLAFIFLNIIYFLFGIFMLKANPDSAFSVLKNYAFYPLIYFIVIVLINNKERLKSLFYFFLAGAIGVVGFVILGILSGQGLWTQFTPLSTEGVRILAFPHGLYISLAFVVLLVYLTIDKPIGKFLYWLLAIWIVGIIGTMMRHIWIAVFLATFFVYFIFSKENKQILKNIILKYGLAFICLVICVFYLMSMNPSSRLYYAIQGTTKAVVQRGVSIGSARQDESFAWRELVWDASFEKFKENPILGIGTGEKIYVETQNYQDYIEVRNIHNSYLAILIQLGVLGLGMFLLFLYGNIKKLVREIFKNRNNFYAISILSVILIFLVALNFQPYLETNLLSIFFWISLGLSNRLSKK